MFVLLISLQAKNTSSADGPSTSTKAAHVDEVPADDDDELDMDELNELEASLAKTSIQIEEPSK